MKNPPESIGPCARSLVRALRAAKRAPVVDLGAFRRGKAWAEELQRSVVSREGLADLHPAHAVYVYMQNQVSVLSEQLTALREMARLADLIEAAQDEYLPGGPPMSPLTTSYFTCWAFFDAAVGRQRETVGTCILAVGEVLGMSPDFLALVEVMQRSSMRVYVHEGIQADGTTRLRDLLGGDCLSCIVPSGWRGARGELWLARVLPPPVSTVDVSVVFTTPYVLGRATERDWIAYFDRTLGAAKLDAKETTARLKHAIDWNEYIFAAYAGNVTEAIFLEGLPDVPASLPHYSPRKGR